MNTLKGLPYATCSGQDPNQALLAYCSMPINAPLHSSAEMLYQQVLCTTVPQQIRYTDPHAVAECDHLNQHATQSAEYHNQWGCCKKPPFFVGQTAFVLNDTRNIWLPTNIICKANNGSYLVQVIGGGQYRCACDHIWECHPDAVKPETYNIGDVAPAASISAPATQAVIPPTAVASQCQHQLHQQLHCKLHAKLHLQYIHHNEHRCHPLEPLWARLAPSILCWSTWSRKPPSSFLKRYRPWLCPADEPDDAMTQNAPVKLLKCWTLN